MQVKYIIYKKAIWFDEPKWFECRSFLNFKSQVQAIEYCKKNKLEYTIWG